MSAAANRLLALLAAAGVVVVAASCDKDPTRPSGVLALVACPTGPLGVNNPIPLSFTEDVSASSVSSANIVVTDANTGFEIPGSVRLAAGNARQVIFTPSQQLAYDQPVRIRVQNLLAAGSLASLNVTVCNLQTELPPIRELYWRALPSAGGNDLVGVSLVSPTKGFITALGDRIFRYDDTSATAGTTTLPLPPYYGSSNDAAFVSATHGFAAVGDQRNFRGVLLETLDGGITYDTLFSVDRLSLFRTYFRPIPNADTPFGVVAGGSSFSPAFFAKYHPATKSFTSTSFSATAGVHDVDFSNDTTLGAAVTLGIKLGTRSVFGAVFTSKDGGSTWQEVAGSRASDSVVVYRGVAVLPNGVIWITGGNGYVAKLTPGATGYSIQRVTLPGLTSLNPADPYALIYHDVQFAPGSTQQGWIVGARQVGTVAGVPRYEGIIFATRDGGQTWIRQGVGGAPNYGAEFPALQRLDVLSANVAWIAGDGGAVLRYAGAPTP